jgi:hypothetical protein
MKWTTEIPKIEGFYWARNSQYLVDDNGSEDKSSLLSSSDLAL